MVLLRQFGAWVFQPACYIQQRVVNVEHFGVQLHSEI